MRNCTISTMNNIYNYSGQRLNIDKLLHLHPERWQPSLSNELGSMTNGIRNAKQLGTDLQVKLRPGPSPRVLQLTVRRQKP